MRTNDETIYNGKVAENEGNPQVVNENKKETWKYVGLGTATGILIGAGAIYAGTANASDNGGLESTNNLENADGGQVFDAATTGNETSIVAHVTPGQSFSGAFSQARSEVGPGGVFHWNGGVYNTFTKEEWDSMSAAEKNDFLAHVRPEFSVDQIDTNHLTAETPTANVRHLDNQETPDDDLGFTAEEFEIEGHQGVYIQPTNGEDDDLVIVDINDNGIIDDGEIVNLETGEVYSTDGTVMAVIDLEDNNSVDDNPNTGGTGGNQETRYAADNVSEDIFEENDQIEEELLEEPDFSYLYPDSLT